MPWTEQAGLMATDIAFWLLGLQDPDYPIEQVGRLSSEISEKFRSLAIMQLLGEASTDLFLHNLMRSARARVTFLERLQREGIVDDYYRASGRYGPLIDAIAAADFDCARRIAELSPVEMQPGEYDDDYLYAQILHRLIQEDPPVAELNALATQLEAFLNGEPSARLDAARALITADQQAFEAAFEDLLFDFEARVRKAKERGQLEEPMVLAQRAVFMEGLAVLQLAENGGLLTDSEYPYCPALARRPMQAAFRQV